MPKSKKDIQSQMKNSPSELNMSQLYHMNDSSGEVHKNPQSQASIKCVDDHPSGIKEEEFDQQWQQFGDNEIEIQVQNSEAEEEK